MAIDRSVGLRPALVVLAAAWPLTAAASSTNFGLAGAASVVSLLRLLVGAGIVAVLLARRGQIAELVGSLVASSLGRLLLESRDDVSPTTMAANRRRMALDAADVLDLVYLLLGYALLRTPLADELQLVVPPPPAAGVVTAVAGVTWLVLFIRLEAVPGELGALLAVLLGAPLLLTLPILDARLVRDLPVLATGAIAWVRGVALLLLLVAGGRLDRGVLGTYAATDESAHERRQSAFGRLVGAFIDVGLLVLAYWIVGAPVANSLVRSSGQALDRRCRARRAPGGDRRRSCGSHRMHPPDAVANGRPRLARPSNS